MIVIRRMLASPRLALMALAMVGPAHACEPLPQPPSSMDILGPAAVGQALQPEVLGRHAAAYLGSWLSSRVDRCEVEPDPATLRPIMLSAGAASLRVRPLPDDTRPAARMPLWIDVLVDGRLERSVLVTSRVRAYGVAWTARTDLAAGTRLDPIFLTRREIDVAAAGVTPWRGEPAGAVLRTRVLRGSALTAQNVAPALAVARGDRVMASSRVGGIEVLAAAQALQDADIGQRIQVRVEAAQGPVLATVREPGRVEIGQ